MISVVIPTYNRAQTIRMAVDSVLNQTYRDIELIIVDDASTDGTQDVVTQIADDRIRYLRLEQRSGACNARNIGALSARGEFISFQDSDDKWHLDKLEKQYQFMIDRNLDFSFCGMTRIMLEDPNTRIYWQQSWNDTWKTTRRCLLCFISCGVTNYDGKICSVKKY